jgi:predicted lipid carrier protein YhbT
MLAQKLLLDFFLDDVDNTTSTLDGKIKTDQSTSSKATHTSSSDVEKAMNIIKNMLSADLVKKMNGVYAFHISDASPQDWFLDLKNGNGQLASGKFGGQTNVTLTMKSEIFINMVSGSLKPTSAFMSGKLKIKGDMNLAMKLEKLMASLSLKPKL